MALPVAVLDACVLFPEWLRDLFLRLAEAGLIRIAWTDEILEEMRRNLEKSRGLTPDKTAKLLSAMRRAFPDAEVDGYAEHIASMTNHPKDRHVLAAAHALARSERRAVVVTANLKDFPRSSWPRNVKVLSPDEFLLKVFRGNRAAVVDIIWAHAQSRKSPPVAVLQLLEGLFAHASKFVLELLKVVATRTDEQVHELTLRVDSSLENPREYLVAMQDLVLVDTTFRGEATEWARNISREVYSHVLVGLADPRNQDVLLSVLRKQGVSMPLEEILKLTSEELLLVIDQAAHSSH